MPRVRVFSSTSSEMNEKKKYKNLKMMYVYWQGGCFDPGSCHHCSFESDTIIVKLFIAIPIVIFIGCGLPLQNVKMKNY